MIVVSDTSPLTNLFQIGRLQLVHELFDDVVIPGAVAAEIEFLEHNRAILTQNPWIRLVEVKDRTLLRDFTENIDSGEAEAIVFGHPAECRCNFDRRDAGALRSYPAGTRCYRSGRRSDPRQA